VCTSPEPEEIVVCLGSSCFARGNAEHLAVIQEYLKSRGLEASVRVSGHLCEDCCKQGPNVTIGGQMHHEVTARMLRDLLQSLGTAPGGEHGED
jgi:NADH:ubiquinone oxidoreductase subunit E